MYTTIINNKEDQSCDELALISAAELLVKRRNKKWGLGSPNLSGSQDSLSLFQTGITFIQLII